MFDEHFLYFFWGRKVGFSTFFYSVFTIQHRKSIQMLTENQNILYKIHQLRRTMSKSNFKESYWYELIWCISSCAFKIFRKMQSIEGFTFFIRYHSAGHFPPILWFRKFGEFFPIFLNFLNSKFFPKNLSRQCKNSPQKKEKAGAGAATHICQIINWFWRFHAKKLTIPEHFKNFSMFLHKKIVLWIIIFQNFEHFYK